MTDRVTSSQAVAQTTNRLLVALLLIWPCFKQECSPRDQSFMVVALAWKIQTLAFDLGLQSCIDNFFCHHPQDNKLMAAMVNN